MASAWSWSFCSTVSRTLNIESGGLQAPWSSDRFSKSSDIVAITFVDADRRSTFTNSRIHPCSAFHHGILVSKTHSSKLTSALFRNCYRERAKCAWASFSFRGAVRMPDYTTNA